MRVRKYRVAALIYLLAGMALVPFAVSPAGAQDAAPAQQDEQQIAQCLDAVRKAASDARACVGVVADPCLEAPDNASTVSAMECMARETRVWTRMLDARYGEIAQTLDDGGEERFSDVQRVWTRYRDRRCALGEVLYEDGSLARVWAATCMLEETGRRAIELDSLLQELKAR